MAVSGGFLLPVPIWLAASGARAPLPAAFSFPDFWRVFSGFVDSDCLSSEMRGLFRRPISANTSISLANLAEVTLKRTFVRPPPQKLGAMSETTSRHLLKAHFDNKLRFQRLPVGRTLGAPSTRSAGCLTRESRLPSQRLQPSCQVWLLCVGNG